MSKMKRCHGHADLFVIADGHLRIGRLVSWMEVFALGLSLLRAMRPLIRARPCADY